MLLRSKASRAGKNRYRGALGLVSTQVGNSLVFSSSPITRWGGSPARRIGPVVSVGPIPVRPVGPAYPVTRTPGGPISPAWGTSGNGWGSGWSGGSNGWGGGGWSAQNNPYGSTPQNPQNSQALAAAMALYASNPSLLTSQQYQLLQQAGVIANTVPYSSVSQIPASGGSGTSSSTNDPQCVAAVCTGGPYPNCTCAAAATSGLSADYAGLPLWGWLAIGAGGVYLFTRKR